MERFGVSLRSSWSLLLVALGTASCSGSSGGGGPVGVDNPTQAYVVDRMVRVFAGVAQLELLVPVLLAPSARAAAGITFELDLGGPPNTYDYSIPLDSDGDGGLDTTIEGSVTFNGDPTDPGSFMAGFQGTTQVLVTTDAGLATFTADLVVGFDLGGVFAVSGNGTFDDTGHGATVVMTVSGANPLRVKSATSDSDERSNACTFSVEGEVDVAATDADGDYGATWVFDPLSRLVDVIGATFTPIGGLQEMLPDSRFEADPCPETGSFQDWAGSYTFDWFCVPTEMSQSAITVTVLNANTIEIVDEDPPGSGDLLIYRATRDPHDPHIVRGTFQETDSGGTYEETFRWILSADASTFRQASGYLYLSGPGAGSVGICGGVGVRD